MIYKFLLAQNEVCLPIESFDPWQENHDGFERSSEVKITFQYYQAEYPHFPQGNVFIYSIKDQKINEFDLKVKEIKLDLSGKAKVWAKLVKVIDGSNPIPNFLLALICEEKLKSIGIL